MQIDIVPGEGTDEPDDLVIVPTRFLVEQTMDDEGERALAANPGEELERAGEQMRQRYAEASTSLVRPKARRRKLERYEYAGADLYAGYTNMLVRTALVRSADWEPGETGPIIGSFDAAVELAAHMRHLDHERLLQICVNGRNELLAIHEAGVGGRHGAQVTFDIVKVPLLVTASAVILVHNHPSGDPNPSPEDVRLTRQIKDAYDCIAVTLLDHIIVAAGGATSLLEMGVMGR